jgi:hypothetical protein
LAADYLSSFDKLRTGNRDFLGTDFQVVVVEFVGKMGWRNLVVGFRIVIEISRVSPNFRFKLKTSHRHLLSSHFQKILNTELLQKYELEPDA